jgi:7-carboxy-7-deazaguanine synthase
MLINDIFFSFQGEGPLLGIPQIFIRFANCNLDCNYCDEYTGVKNAKEYQVNEVLSTLAPLYKENPHSISITGGEPLLQVESLKELLPNIPIPLYLETNGTLPKHLSEIINFFTYFSVDYKPGFETEFIDFLSLLKDRENVFVKFIITRQTSIKDMQKVSKIISSINDKLPLILQPVTPFSGYKEKAKSEDILRAYNVARQYLKEIRIIPQTHKIIGIK